jgi:hypothetical protein
VQAAVLLAAFIGTLYGLWQAVSGRRASITAATSLAVVVSIAVFYLTDLVLWLLTRRPTTAAFWLGLFTSGLSFALVLARQARRYQFRVTAVVGASVFGVISAVVLAVFLGVYVGCRFSDCRLP